MANLEMGGNLQWFVSREVGELRKLHKEYQENDRVLIVAMGDDTEVVLAPVNGRKGAWLENTTTQPVGLCMACSLRRNGEVTSVLMDASS